MNFSKSESTTLNKTYRSKKFFLCVHQTPDKEIGFEKCDERFTQFTYLSYGYGKFHFFYDDKIETIDGKITKHLYDLRQYVNCSVVAETKMDSKIISFNPWRKEEYWEGRLIDKSEKVITTDNDYACVICFEGNCMVNRKTFKELDFADIIKNKEYKVEIPDSTYIGLFELVSS